MTTIRKTLYFFCAQEIVVLLEKVDATASTVDSSFQAAKRLLDEGTFNFFERKLLASAIKKVARRETLANAMNIVVFNKAGERYPREEADTYNAKRGGVISMSSPYQQAQGQKQ